MAEDLKIKLTLDTKDYHAKLKGIERDTTKSTDKMGTSWGEMRTPILLTTAALAAAGFAAKKLVDSAAGIETLKTQLETLTGSAFRANMLFKELADFSAGTPFQLPGIVNASKKLLSFGFSQTEVIDKMRELGDVAAGSGTDLNELALIFGQVRAAGKLTGERLLQLQERAVPIGPAIAKSMGVAESSLRDMVSQGKITAEEFEKAFSTMSAEGGMFFEGMQRQSKTFEGLKSTLSDNINLLAADLGNNLLPAAKETVSSMIDLVQTFREWVPEIKKVNEEFLPGLIVRMGEYIGVLEEGTTKTIELHRAREEARRSLWDMERALDEEQLLEKEAAEAAAKKKAETAAALAKKEAEKKAKEELKILKYTEKQKTRIKFMEEMTRARMVKTFGDIASGFAKDGSIGQLALQTAAAMASMYISTEAAAALALANPPGPPYTAPLSAAVRAQGQTNMALVAATNLAKYFQKAEIGGTVQRAFGTPERGDFQHILAAPKELFLKQDDTKLVRAASKEILAGGRRDPVDDFFNDEGIKVDVGIELGDNASNAIQVDRITQQALGTAV